MKVYEPAPVVPQDVAHELLAYSPLVQRLLFQRDIKTKKNAEAFLAPNFEHDRHDPFLLTDMEIAVSRILHALQTNEHLAIWSDYDCDGIPGGVVLHDFFQMVGFTNFENYIPHRHDEGFGLNVEGIRALAARGVTLIITIDCGSTNILEVEEATRHGISVIITDHHELGSKVPPAYAIINPKRDDAYPFRELCGSGVVWKLVEALIVQGNFSLTPGKEKWLLDMVGLATLSDMVPLSGENRVLAHFGLTVLKKSPRPGLSALFRATRVNKQMLTEDDVAFSITPRINSASRMGSPHEAFLLFTAKDEVAEQQVKRLEVINNERKGHVGALKKIIDKRLRDRGTLLPLIALGDPAWRPSLLGLSAHSLAETHGRPVFLWGRDGRGAIKGSCRSNGAISVIALMEAARDVFIEFGGHHGSGGFSIKETRIHDLQSELLDAFALVSATASSARAVTVIDAELSLHEASEATLRDVRQLSPFGVGNPKPLFRFPGVTIERVERFGAAKEHLKLSLTDLRARREAVAFFSDGETFSRRVQAGEVVDIIGHLELSTFRNRPQIRIRLVDVA